MSTPVPITNHAIQGLTRRLQAYKGKPRFEAWCRAPLGQVQELEAAASAFLAGLDVDTAGVGVLNALGKIVGQVPIADLETMRRAVKIRVLVNKSPGTAPALIKISRVLLAPIAGGPPGEIIYTEYQPATVLIEAVAGVTGLDGLFAIGVLKLAKMAGVALRLVASTHDDGFLFGTTPGEADSVNGFSATLSDGGYLAGIW